MFLKANLKKSDLQKSLTKIDLLNVSKFNLYINKDDNMHKSKAQKWHLQSVRTEYSKDNCIKVDT